MPDSVILEAGVGNFSEYGSEEVIISYNSWGLGREDMGGDEVCTRSWGSRKSDVKVEWYHMNAKDRGCPQTDGAARSYPEERH